MKIVLKDYENITEDKLWLFARTLFRDWQQINVFSLLQVLMIWSLCLKFQINFELKDWFTRRNIHYYINEVLANIINMKHIIN